MQNDFPETYGIGQYGVAESASPRRKAQARQLKAYLLFFEQIMANFLANLQSVSRLFSLERSLVQSYFHQWLDNTTVPNVEALYQGEPEAIDGKVAEVVARHDPFADRRSRVLDYLLSIYGECFTQRSLRCFNYYTADQDADAVLVENKLRLLEALVEVSRNRGSAFNYREPAWGNDNIAGLKRKVSILLGFNDLWSRSLTSALADKGLKWIEDDELERLIHASSDWDTLDPGIPDEHIDREFVGIDLEGGGIVDGKWDEAREARLFEEIIFLKHRVVSDAFLKNSVFRDRYRVGSTDGGSRFQLLFRADQKAPWWQLATYETERQAALSAEALRYLAIALNADSEGVHLVEHVLLRPMGGKTDGNAVPVDFYAFRLSVIFPSWTTRCGDHEFRKLAKETVQLSCPAHVYPEFHWLDVRAMDEFETRYADWLDVKCAERSEAEAIDAAAQRLLAFLLERRGETGGGG